MEKWTAERQHSVDYTEEAEREQHEKVMALKKGTVGFSVKLMQQVLSLKTDGEEKKGPTGTKNSRLTAQRDSRQAE